MWNLESLQSIWSSCLETTSGQHAHTPKCKSKQQPHTFCWMKKTLKASDVETDSPISYHLWRNVGQRWTLSWGQQQSVEHTGNQCVWKGFTVFTAAFQPARAVCCFSINLTNVHLSWLTLSRPRWRPSLSAVITSASWHSVLAGIQSTGHDLMFWKCNAIQNKADECWVCEGSCTL